MTNGQFLSIGQLACSACKAKSLKSLDFSNSFILPDAGHPLSNQKPTWVCDSQSQAVISPKKEAEDPVSVPTVDATKAKPLLISHDINNRFHESIQPFSFTSIRSSKGQAKSDR